VRRSAAELGFTVERQTIELTGHCPDCRSAAPDVAHGD
jgi:Fe2+ or Zn2+ uptake regulation protein